MCVRGTSEDIYPKGGKKTRWDKETDDVDEKAGEVDAEHEALVEDGEEEEEAVCDPLVNPNEPSLVIVQVEESQNAPESLALPVVPVDESQDAPQSLAAPVVPVEESQDAPVEESQDAPQSLAVTPVEESQNAPLTTCPEWLAGLVTSDSPTSLPSTVPVTPVRQEPRPSQLQLTTHQEIYTPTPVSPPVLVKEVLLIVDTPKKCLVKAEMPEETCPEGVQELRRAREHLQEAVPEDVPAPLQEPVQEPARAAVEKMDKHVAMRELALLEAELLQSQHARCAETYVHAM